MILLATTLVACSRPIPRPFAAAGVRPRTGDLVVAMGPPRPGTSVAELEYSANKVLDPGEQQAVRTILGGLAEDHLPTHRPEPRPEGRWSDVTLAVRQACDAQGVEMAIVDARRGEREIVFALRTVEDRPAELIVRREDASPGWSATATVGRFRDDEPRAAKLLAEFDRAMRAYGAKRKFD